DEQAATRTQLLAAIAIARIRPISHMIDATELALRLRSQFVAQPPSLPAAFRKLDAVMVLTDRLLPVPGSIGALGPGRCLALAAACQAGEVGGAPYWRAYLGCGDARHGVGEGGEVEVRQVV